MLRVLVQSGLRLLGVVVLTASAAGALIAQGSRSPQTPERDRLSLATMRWINTVQAEYRRQHGRFADLPELLRLDPRPPGWNANDDGASPVPPSGLAVSVLVDGRGQRYSAAVGNRESCAWRYFSDESGVISMGRPLGCERDVATTPAR